MLRVDVEVGLRVECCGKIPGSGCRRKAECSHTLHQARCGVTGRMIKYMTDGAQRSIVRNITPPTPSSSPTPISTIP